jgi:Tol biopolymer transport system component
MTHLTMPRLLVVLLVVVVLLGAAALLVPRLMPGPPASDFHAGAARVVYLAPDAQGVYNLWAVAVISGTTPFGDSEAVRLSNFPGGVWDYAVSPDGTRIAASVLDAPEALTGDLWLLDNTGANAHRLVDCGDGGCRAPSWAPDGTRLAFERHENAPGTLVDQSLIWVVPAAGGEPAPLLPGLAGAGHSPRWSPDGNQIAFVTEDHGAIFVANLVDGQHTTLNSQLGEPPAWAPDGQSFVAGDIVPIGEAFVTHLFVTDLRDGQARELDTRVLAEDGSPAWSPGGDVIAFGRKYLGGDGPITLGRQLCLVRPDGGDLRVLTDDAIANYSAYAWSPDAARIAAVRFAVGVPGAQPEVWVFDVAGGTGRQLVGNATQPGWLP